jgi:hypothetical protein
MDQTEAPKALSSERILGKFRNEEAALIANDNIRNGPGTIYKNSDLPIELAGKFNHSCREFGSDHFGYRNTPAVKTLQPAQLA